MPWYVHRYQIQMMTREIEGRTGPLFLQLRAGSGRCSRSSRRSCPSAPGPCWFGRATLPTPSSPVGLDDPLSYPGWPAVDFRRGYQWLPALGELEAVISAVTGWMSEHDDRVANDE